MRVLVRRPIRRFLLAAFGALLLAGCGIGGPEAPVVRPPASGATSPVQATAPDGRGAVRPLPAPTCTTTVQTPDALELTLATVAPGAKVCLLGNLGGARLTVRTSGTAQAPIQIFGDGQTAVHGVTVEGSFVTISGVNVLNPDAPGISLAGDNITVENSTSISPRGDDGDALRFWGNNITIRHNTMRDTRNLNGAHADCMQTFATDADHAASQHIVIDANRCEQIDNTCLIVEGPHSLAGDGSGVGATSDITFTNNYCQNHAGEALQIDDAQNLTITNNEIASDQMDHAFALQNRSTGAKVSDNKVSSQLNYEVGLDESSAAGYQGPQPTGHP
ncbi:right-handed parallel beta-helix repeat-containing protein [Pseudonocardia acaciae]|uniref:right-handed parallel beta-helix repeat-containing protein n=1 Tax=Pseudonocardia acaciae TaxID=551276 RepID=UPI0006866B07|nr:right-handed parallel beta-helix repeat-containing protein [Pseudonocardia acaciae]